MGKFLCEMPEILCDWDYARNEGIDISKVTFGSIKNYCWKCHVCGYEWSTSMNSRSRGSGCPCCTNRIIVKGINDLSTTNPELLNEWNFELNKDISPYEVSHGSGRKAWWICKKCSNTWETSIAKRTNGRNCPICAGKKVIAGYNDLQTLFPNLSEEWDYSANRKSPSEYTISSNKRVGWICKKCKTRWSASIASRTKGAGCPKCAQFVRNNKAKGRVVKEEYNLQIIYPDLSEEWHPYRNGKLCPKGVAPQSN